MPIGKTNFSLVKKKILPIVRTTFVLASLLILTVMHLITPFTGDVLTSFGAAFQADYYGNFPSNVYNSWNLRGIGYKYLFYILYKLTDIFTDTARTLHFHIIVKSIYYCFFLSLSCYFFLQLKHEFEKIRVPWTNAFVIFLYGLLTFSHHNMLQAEELSILVTLAMLNFSISNNRFLNYLSGIFIAVLVSLKSVTILYAGYPCMLLLYLAQTSQQRSFVRKRNRFLISSVIFGGCTVLFYIFVIPQEILDTYHATLFQYSFQIGRATFVWFLIKFFQQGVSHAPFIMTGFLCCCLLIVHLLRKQMFRELGYLVLIVCIPVLGVVMQNNFFAYHYTIFFPCFFLLIVYLLHRVRWQKIVVYASCFITIVVWIITIFLVENLTIYLKPSSHIFSTIYLTLNDPFANYFYYNETYYRPEQDLFLAIDQEFELQQEPEMLFLSDGQINFFIQPQSYLRYFYPLPLQRSSKYPKLKESVIYIETLQKVLEYSGQYIWWDDYWFPLAYFPDLQKKVSVEYEPVYEANLPHMTATLLKRKQ